MKPSKKRNEKCTATEQLKPLAIRGHPSVLHQKTLGSNHYKCVLNVCIKTGYRMPQSFKVNSGVQEGDTAIIGIIIDTIYKHLIVTYVLCFRVQNA